MNQEQKKHERLVCFFKFELLKFDQCEKSKFIR